MVDGAMTIRDLNRATEWNLPDEEANTIAGLVIHEAQMIPTAGQVFSFHGFRFEVIARDGNRITALRIRPLDALGAYAPQPFPRRIKRWFCEDDAPCVVCLAP